MPLHAITSTYGEAGLRDRFEAEIASWPEADRRRMERALDLAARLHAADRREREPYVNHLLRVAIRIMSHYGVRDADVVCAALLHDAVEDHAGRAGRGVADPDAALAGAGRRVRPAGGRTGRRGDQPGLRARPRPGRAVPGARRGQPARQSVGAGHQGLRLHRQRRRSDAHHRAPAAPARAASTRRWSRSWPISSPGRTLRWTPRPRSASWPSSTGPRTGSPPCWPEDLPGPNGGGGQPPLLIAHAYGCFSRDEA